VEDPKTPERSAAKGIRLVWFVLLGLVAALGLWLAAHWWFAPGAPADDDPLAAFQSPFQNTRPGVHYIGDAACAQCHADIEESYRKHPMGRSLAPLSAASLREKLPTSFEAQGFRYTVAERGGHVFHEEVRRDAMGQTIARIDAEVQFVLGSGRRGHSYLVNRAGYLFQSPISWYAQKRRWDLSPGYDTIHQHFERPIGGQCLFCHANQARPVEQTVNRYEEPIFRGHAIGCERCHGPGELHENHPGKIKGVDPTIVNPRHLPADLREDVCQQCHLQGQVRVMRAGRQVFDFRPGLPLPLFWSVFVPPPDYPDQQKAIGQVEQMYLSRCFQQSQGKLGCISCHDPHRVPASAEKLAFYRDRCLSCHQDNAGKLPTRGTSARQKACSLPPDVRLLQNKEDSCIACHMHRVSTDIIHTVMTDHRVLRLPEKGDRQPPAPRQFSLLDMPLVPFHRDRGRQDAKALDRDLGVALTLWTRTLDEGPLRKELGSIAQAKLDAAASIRQGDAIARQAQAYALWLQGRGENALAAYEGALAIAPRSEPTLADAAELAARLGQRTRAVGYWQRAIALDPYRSGYHYQLAELYAADGHWRQAGQACRQALRLNPALAKARKLLVRCYQRLNETQKARAELDVLLGFDPLDKDELRRWFAQPP
jgi:tetratricopeptide (TPR) repeat protein